MNIKARSTKHEARNEGFTLVETLIAVTILTISVTGSFFVANNALVAAATSRDRLTASYLAQEGIEHVRLQRDNYYLARYPAVIDVNGVNLAWDDFISWVNTTGGVLPYPAPSLDSTAFTRTLRATAITGTDEKIVSTVSWSYHSNTYSVVIIDHLTPWQ